MLSSCSVKMATMSGSSVVSEDMPPPLEDMSELLRTVGSTRDFFVKPKGTVNKSASAGPESYSSMSKAEDDARQIQRHAWKDNDKQENSRSVQTKQTQPDTFCGFKTGFLLPKSKTGKSTTKEDNGDFKAGDSSNVSEPDIPFIKPRIQSPEDGGFSIPEVQQAMDASRSLFENKDWVTDDLLKKIQNNDVLAKKLSNPGFAQALNEFQRNPKAAMAKYGSNPEMQAFLMEFCGLLGEHFTQLGDVQTPQTSHTAGQRITDTHSSTAMASSDEVKMQEILAKTEVRDALMDGDIQRLLETLRTNPDAAQRFLATSNREQREKVKILVDNGLLQFET